MRLVVLGPGHPFRGGVARATTSMVRALSERGHRVDFLTPRRQYPAALYPGAGDRDPDACERLDRARAVLDPFAPAGWPRLRRELVATGGDAWLFPYWTWVWSALWRYLLGAGRRPPAVAVVHNPADHDAGAVHRLAARLVLARCDGLFTHGEGLRRRLENAYPSLLTASHPLPASAPSAGADRDRLAPPAGRRIALFVGLIRPYKGVDLLLEAVARLPEESDWSVLVAGEPWHGLGRRLEAQVARLGLGARVRLDLRWIPEGELGALFDAADLVVLPYRSGSQSAVAPTALAHGVPVLATDVGALGEVVEDGVNGRLVRAGSAGALAAALEELDRENLVRLAAGARRSAARLTWSGYAAALETLLAEVVDQHAGKIRPSEG